MKTQPRRSERLQQRRFEADVEARVRALFRRCPALCGFSVGDAGRGPALTELCVYPSSGFSAPADLCHEIVATLAELVDERPEAAALLRGRTFARVLH